ncbi:MAG: UDP-N-acetylglucosamine 2-epimerase [Pseudonocardiaceae bacterium]|nr:MAG: UDP-N-acetylglucosamine 2-epimerase [Pseudonocardiaceae bacterium]
MTAFERLIGELPDDHEHDVLLVAGTRPAVARLAPVATAIAEADRIRGLTVATGPDPMATHDAFEALGVPADITLLLSEHPGYTPAAVASALTAKLDRLMVEQDPSAVMIYGGGMTALIAAQVAFWRMIPVVHLQAGVATDDLLCPFPEEANRRVIGQLASLFLTTSGPTLGSPLGPNVLQVGDTIGSNPPPDDLRFAKTVMRVADGRSRLVVAGLDSPSSVEVVADLPALLDRDDDLEVVLFGDLCGDADAEVLARHERAIVVPHLELSELVHLVSSASVLVSDDPELVGDAPGLGTPGVLVDGPHVAEPGDSIRSVVGRHVLDDVWRILDVDPRPQPQVYDGKEAERAEAAVAWMFGLNPFPQVAPRSSDV